MILEEVTGMAFDAYLKKAVFDVCGMTSTGYFELDRLPSLYHREGHCAVLDKP